MNEDESRRIITETNAEVNVTAYENLLSDETRAPLYDGDIIFNRATYSIAEWFAEKTISPGFFKRLEDVAEGIKEILVEATQDFEPFQREDININYNSNVNNSLDGSRGYTDYTGSYLQRQLRESEMEKLIREVDTRIRPLFYDRKR